VNEIYLDALKALNSRMTFARNIDKSKVAAAAQVETSFQKTTEGAVNCIKNYFTNQIAQMRAASSMKAVKELHAHLISFGFLYQFIFKHAPSKREEEEEERDE
jgi:hypothetical protein